MGNENRVGEMVGRKSGQSFGGERPEISGVIGVEPFALDAARRPPAMDALTARIRKSSMKSGKSPPYSNSKGDVGGAARTWEARHRAEELYAERDAGWCATPLQASVDETDSHIVAIDIAASDRRLVRARDNGRRSNSRGSSKAVAKAAATQQLAVAISNKAFSDSARTFPDIGLIGVAVQDGNERRRPLLRAPPIPEPCCPTPRERRNRTPQRSTTISKSFHTASATGPS